MKRDEIVGGIVLALLLAAFAGASCKATSTPQAVHTGIDVSKEACTLIDDTAPDWVTLLCGVVGSLDKTKVTLPRATWARLAAKEGGT